MCVRWKINVISSLTCNRLKCSIRHYRWINVDYGLVLNFPDYVYTRRIINVESSLTCSRLITHNWRQGFRSPCWRHTWGDFRMVAMSSVYTWRLVAFLAMVMWWFTRVVHIFDMCSTVAFCGDGRVMIHLCGPHAWHVSNSDVFVAMVISDNSHVLPLPLKHKNLSERLYYYKLFGYDMAV